MAGLIFFLNNVVKKSQISKKWYGFFVAVFNLLIIKIKKEFKDVSILIF